MRQQLEGKSATKPAYALERKVIWSIGEKVSYLTVTQKSTERYRHRPQTLGVINLRLRGSKLSIDYSVMVHGGTTKEC